MAVIVGSRRVELEPGTSEWWLRRLSKKLDDRQKRIRRLDDYYRGKQTLQFLSPEVRETLAEFFEGLHANICRLVVDAVAERLTVQGFRSQADRTQRDDVAWAIWQRNRMDTLSKRAHRQALVKGISYALVWLDGDDWEASERRARIWIEDPLQVIVEHDPGDPRVRRVALKRWYDDVAQRVYATLYFADRIEKWQGPPKRIPGSGSLSVRLWEKRTVDGEDWPLDHPLGVVPVVPLVAIPDDSGAGGEAEHEPITPLQDAVNKELLDMLVASEYAAFPQRYATGLEVEEAEEADPANPGRVRQRARFTAAIQRMWTSADDRTKFGAFPVADLAPYERVILLLVGLAASIARTPYHYFLNASQSVPPTGESLKSSETGLTAKVRERANELGDGWEELMRVAFLVIGDAARAAAFDAETDWRDPESRTESEHVDALGKLVALLGIPLEGAWERIPATPQEIERWKEMLRGELQELRTQITAARAPTLVGPGQQATAEAAGMPQPTVPA